MKNPEYEVLPAWYELSVKDETTLSVSVHQRIVDFLEEVFSRKKIPIVEALKELFGLGEFISPKEGDWGFAGTLRKTKPINPGWSTWEYFLPVLRHKNGRRGNRQIMTALRASLQVLFSALSIFEEDTGWKKPQLIVIQNLNTSHKMDHSTIWAIITPPMHQWICSLGQDAQKLAETEDFMRKVDRHIWYERKSFATKYGFRVRKVHDHKIYLSVPGDACEISCNGSCPKENSGYNLYPHNIPPDGLNLYGLLLIFSQRFGAFFVYAIL